MQMSPVVGLKLSPFLQTELGTFRAVVGKVAGGGVGAELGGICMMGNGGMILPMKGGMMLPPPEGVEGIEPVNVQFMLFPLSVQLLQVTGEVEWEEETKR